MEGLVYLKLCLFFIFFVNTGLVLCSKSEEIDNLIKGEQNIIDKGEGLIVKIIKEKKNCKKVAEIGDFLDVHYVGRFNDEHGKIFDESRPKGFVYKFQLGAGQVIQGYERGVPGMCKGEKRTLTVPPHLAYGDRDSGPIPGKSTLHFTIDLVDIRKGKLKTLHPAINIPGAGEL